MENLRAAFLDHDYTRIARELGRFRLLDADTDPLDLDVLREAIIWTHDRLEFGWTHAYAGSADWLTLYDSHAADPEARLICLLESIGHMADDTLREPTYPYPQDSRPYDEDAFVTAIDDEDVPGNER